jgi:Holliday junction DNA helicase RuvB
MFDTSLDFSFVLNLFRKKNIEDEDGLLAKPLMANGMVGDLASILTNLEPGTVLFIDEIHQLSRKIEELLYPALESGSLDIILGKGPSARTVELTLPPFTLVGATTRMAQLSSPLRSRFGGGVYQLDFYSDEDLRAIIKRSAELLYLPLTLDRKQYYGKK